MKRNLLFVCKILFVIVVSLSLTSAIVFAWQEATCDPPLCNVSAPVNVSVTGQVKAGDLGVATNGLDASAGLTVGSAATPRGIKVTGDSYFQGKNNLSTGAVFNATNLNNVSILYVRNDGNVGIGTTSPGAKLDVVTGNNSGGIRQTASGVVISTWADSARGGAIGTLSNNDLFFYTNSSGAQMTLQKGTGNVGIGITSPAYKLDVSGTARISGSTTLSALSGADTRMVVVAPTGILSTQAIPGGVGGPVTGSGSVNRVAKFIAPQVIGDSLIFDSGNNVGIGTLNPDGNYRLTLSGGGIKSENATAQPAGYFSSTGGGAALLTGIGNVGIGIAGAPQAKLHVAGDIIASYTVRRNVDNDILCLSGGDDCAANSSPLMLLLGNAFGLGRSGNIEMYLGTAGSSFKINAANNDVLVVTNNAGSAVISSGGTGITLGSGDNISLDDKVHIDNVTGNMTVESLAGASTRLVTASNSGVLSTQALPPGSLIGGSGTVNRVAKFTAATTIGDSQILDNGLSVGIGTVAGVVPTAKVTIGSNITGLIFGTDSWLQIGQSPTPTWNDEGITIGRDSANYVELSWINANNSAFLRTPPGRNLLIYPGYNQASGAYLGIGTVNVDTNYKVTVANGGIKAEGALQPGGYFASVLGPALVTGNGNVGIGTTGPSIKLAIGDSDTGLGWAGDGQLDIYSNNVNTIRVRNGNVGIGIVPTLGVLQVNAGASVAIRADSSGPNAAISGQSSSPGGTGTSGINNSSGNGVYAFSSSGYDFYGAGPKSYFLGNVGLGMAPTTNRLSVDGTALFNLGNSGNVGISTPQGTAGIVFSDTRRADIRWDDSSFSFLVSSGIGAPGATNGLIINSNNGYVGIGTTGATIKLAVGDSDTGLGWAGDGQLNIYSNNVNAISVRNNNVGIGTSGPIQMLDVQGRINVSNGVIQRGGSAINITSDLGLYSRVAGNLIRFVTNGGNFVWFVDDGAGTDQKMRLQTNGDLYIDGSYHCSGADIAELAPAEEPITAGEVVSLSSEKEGKLRRSQKPYEREVAGVVSTNPGMLLGDNIETPKDQELIEVDGVKLALAGRVPVKATAENGLIKVGDLLVTSSKPGYAMKGDMEKIKEMPGVVLGKAMESLKENEGTIMVLINLQ